MGMLQTKVKLGLFLKLGGRYFYFLIQLDLIQLDLIRLNLTQLELTQLTLIPLDLIQLDLAQLAVQASSCHHLDTLQTPTS